MPDLSSGRAPIADAHAGNVPHELIETVNASTPSHSELPASVTTSGVTGHAHFEPEEEGDPAPPTRRVGLRFIVPFAFAQLSVIEERHPGTATTMIGFDDDFTATVAKVTFRARINATRPLEVGAIGAGPWELRVGDRSLRYRQTPAWSVTPVNGDLDYAEGPFIGYRGHHAGRAPQPVFWFGHGLGYSTPRYEQPRLSCDAGSPTVSLTVTNTGSRDSREVVQVYFEPSEADQPVRLVGWQAVRAAAGQSVPVEIRTDRRLWRRWDTARNAWGELTGGGHLLVARGLGDVRATLKLDPASLAAPDAG